MATSRRRQPSRPTEQAPPSSNKTLSAFSQSKSRRQNHDIAAVLLSILLLSPTPRPYPHPYVSTTPRRCSCCPFCFSGFGPDPCGPPSTLHLSSYRHHVVVSCFLVLPLGSCGQRRRLNKHLHIPLSQSSRLCRMLLPAHLGCPCPLLYRPRHASAHPVLACRVADESVSASQRGGDPCPSLLPPRCRRGARWCRWCTIRVDHLTSTTAGHRSGV